MTLGHRTLERLVLTVITGFALTPLFPLECQATALQLGINGNAEIGSNYIDFGQYPYGSSYSSAPGYGDFEVSLVKPGVFASAGVTTGEFGTIQSVNEGTGNIALSSPFMTFNTGGAALTLNATSIPGGNLGPFVLTDTSFGAVVSFDVDGSVVDVANPVLNQQFIGTFAMTFAGETVAELLNQLPAAAPFTATLNASDSTPVSTNPLPLNPTPEPGSILLVVAGLITIGTVSRSWLRASR